MTAHKRKPRRRLIARLADAVAAGRLSLDAARARLREVRR